MPETIPDAHLPLLRRSWIFETLDELDRDALFRALERVDVLAGEALIRQGRRNQALYLLVEGRVSVQLELQGQRREELGTLVPGEVFGEMSCLDPAPGSATLVAMDDVVAYSLDHAMYQNLRTFAPHITVHIVAGVISHVSERLRSTNEHIARAFQANEVVSAPSDDLDRLNAHLGESTASPLTDLDLESVTTPPGMTVHDLTELLAWSSPGTFREGDLLCREEFQGRSCYLVLEGTVQVTRHQRPLGELGPGVIIGQLGMDGAPRSATVSARGAVKVLEFSREQLERLMASGTLTAIRLQEVIAVSGVRQLRAANVWLGNLLSFPSDIAYPLHRLRPKASRSRWKAPDRE